MHIGIAAGTIERSSLSETLDAVAGYDISCMQFDLSSVGLCTLPDNIDSELCNNIREEFGAHGILMSAVSGTFNMAHPDEKHRADGLRRLRVLASACEKLGTSVIALCTGTRNASDMWQSHPDNSSPEAWKDMVTTMRQAVHIAEDAQVTLAFEPEVSNVVDSAKKARRLLDEVDSVRLKVVIDGANLFHRGELPRMREILDEAFVLLSKDIVIAHGKDLDRDGEAGHLAAGKGLLDYGHYVSLLSNLGFDAPIILHGLSETEVPESVAFIRHEMEKIDS